MLSGISILFTPDIICSNPFEILVSPAFKFFPPVSSIPKFLFTVSIPLEIALTPSFNFPAPSDNSVVLLLKVLIPLSISV